MRCVVHRAVLAATLVLGCDRDAPVAAAEPTPPASSATPPPAAQPAPPADGPAAPGGTATEQDRANAVFTLLEGGEVATRLSVVEVDPGDEFDPGLAERLSPATVGSGLLRVGQAEVTVTGPLDRDIVRRVLRSHVNEVRHCYGLARLRRPTLAGRASFAFAIDPTGETRDVTATESTASDPTMGRCVIKAIGRWRFPAVGDVKVAVSFDLSSTQ